MSLSSSRLPFKAEAARSQAAALFAMHDGDDDEMRKKVAG